MSMFAPAFYSPGPMEVAIILVVVLIVFGPGKLPDVFKALGTGMRQFKEAANPEQFAVKPNPPAVETTQSTATSNTEAPIPVGAASGQA